MEERMVALDFRCDESRNLPDMRGSSMIFMNVQVIGARKRHLVRQHRNERRVAGCDESRQQKPLPVRVAWSCQDVRASDAGFDPDRIGETDLRREQQLIGKAYKGCLLRSSLAAMGAASLR